MEHNGDTISTGIIRSEQPSTIPSSSKFVSYPQPTHNELVDAFNVLLQRPWSGKDACLHAETFLKERQFHCIIIHQLLVFYLLLIMS